jgi:hypothetical protein
MAAAKAAMLRDPAGASASVAKAYGEMQASRTKAMVEISGGR